MKTISFDGKNRAVAKELPNFAQ